VRSSPVILYLDTQDYINLSKKNIIQEHKVVLDFLEKYVDEGQLLVGFSALNVFEFITRPEDNFLHDRRARGEFISRLCGQNCFPHFVDMKRGAKFPNKGMWLPLELMNLFTPERLKISFRREAQKLISSEKSLNRKQRRELSNPKILGSTLRPLLHKIEPIRDVSGVPIPESIIKEKLLEKFLVGDVSAHRLSQRLTRWLVDPASFADVYYSYGGNISPIEQFFEAPINGMQDAFEQLATSWSTMKNLREVHKKNLREFEKAQRAAGEIADKISETRRKLKIKMPKISVNLEPIEEKIGRGRVSHVSPWLEEKIKSGKKFVRSDYLDILHLIYAYDCDLFRCDKDTASALRGHEPLASKLVSSLTDLPARIEQLVHPN